MTPAVVATPLPLLSSWETAGADAAASLRRLTVALARGDDAAWARFHADYGPAIFRQLLALTQGDHDLAKEALQRTYLRIAKSVRPCDVEPVFKAWLRIVARTALQDCWRRRRSFRDLLFRKQQQPPELEDPAANDRLTAALDLALARLEPGERGLLEAKYFSGADVRTLADRLGISPKAAESRLTRARETLRRELLHVLQRHD